MADSTDWTFSLFQWQTHVYVYKSVYQDICILSIAHGSRVCIFTPVILFRFYWISSSFRLDSFVRSFVLWLCGHDWFQLKHVNAPNSDTHPPYWTNAILLCTFVTAKFLLHFFFSFCSFLFIQYNLKWMKRMITIFAKAKAISRWVSIVRMYHTFHFWFAINF